MLPDMVPPVISSSRDGGRRSGPEVLPASLRAHAWAAMTAARACYAAAAGPLMVTGPDRARHMP